MGRQGFRFRGLPSKRKPSMPAHGIARGVFGTRKAQSEALVQMVEKHSIRPLIAKTFE